MPRLARACRLLLCVVVYGGAVSAQRRAPAPPRIAVTHVARVPANDARSALRAHVAAITRCIDDARANDPTRLALLRWIDATLELDRGGTPSTVELSPPITARGLSACLAETLLDWTMRGPLSPGATVVIRITVEPAGR